MVALNFDEWLSGKGIQIRGWYGKDQRSATWVVYGLGDREVSVIARPKYTGDGWEVPYVNGRDVKSGPSGTLELGGDSSKPISRVIEDALEKLLVKPDRIN